MKIKLTLILTLLFFNSCSVYNIANKHIYHILNKNGLTYQSIQLNNYTINYWDSENEKPVLILLHGFGATTEFQWYKQVKDLSVNYRLILPNLLYFGGSTSTIPSYSIKNQLEAMQLLIDKLTVKTFDLCGVSYGGVVAAELALANQSKVKKLILVDSPVKYFNDADIKSINEKFKVSGLIDLLAPNTYKGLKTLLEIAFVKPPLAPTFILKDMFNNMYNKQVEDKKGLLNSVDNEKEFYANQNYPFQFPVMLIWGAEDKLIPLHIGKQLQEHIGENAQLVIMPVLEQAKVFNKIVLEFLKTGN